jgi:hypothetical protein
VGVCAIGAAWSFFNDSLGFAASVAIGVFVWSSHCVTFVSYWVRDDAPREVWANILHSYFGRFFKSAKCSKIPEFQKFLSGLHFLGKSAQKFLSGFHYWSVPLSNLDKFFERLKAALRSVRSA